MYEPGLNLDREIPYPVKLELIIASPGLGNRFHEGGLPGLPERLGLE